MFKFLAANPDFKDFALARRVFANQEFRASDLFINRLNRAIHAGDLRADSLIAHIAAIAHFNRAKNDKVFAVFVGVLDLIHPGFERFTADAHGFSEMGSAGFFSEIVSYFCATAVNAEKPISAAKIAIIKSNCFFIYCSFKNFIVLFLRNKSLDC